MLKMGWKGDGYGERCVAILFFSSPGLGKKQQGMASALIVQKTAGEQGVIINTAGMLCLHSPVNLAAMELEKRSINPTGSLPSRVIVLHVSIPYLFSLLSSFSASIDAYSDG